MADTVDTVGLGNTKTNPRARAWIITLNNPSYGDLEQLTHINCENLIYQFEIGKQGTLHIQGAIRFSNARYFQGVKDLLPTAHIEKAKNWKNVRDYCCKDDSRVKGPFELCEGNPVNIRPEWVDRPLEIIQDYSKWQSDLWKLLQEKPDDRTIHWWWCMGGGSGKTAFVKKLCVENNWIKFARITKSADILTLADREFGAYLLDFARSKQDFCPFDAIEQLKDGLISDGKLKKECRNIIMNRPHVVIFANQEPIKNKLSLDKWDIRQIDESDISDADLIEALDRASHS